MARHIDYIVHHCTAGYGNVESIKRFWRESMGWKSPGYHRIVDLSGNINKLADFEQTTNGVKGYNSTSIHIAYIGGVDRNDYSKAVDTRTDAQEASLIQCTKEALAWCKRNGQDITKIKILGHRDFSPDKNGNGVIEPWERIKECPSFEISEWLENIRLF